MVHLNFYFFFKREQIVTGGRQTICVFYSNKMNQNKLSDYSRLASHVLLLMVGLSGRQNTGESRKTSTNWYRSSVRKKTLASKGNELTCFTRYVRLFGLVGQWLAKRWTTDICDNTRVMLDSQLQAANVHQLLASAGLGQLIYVVFCVTGNISESGCRLFSICPSPSKLSTSLKGL